MKAVFNNKDISELFKAAATTVGGASDTPTAGQLLVKMTPEGITVVGGNGYMETEAWNTDYQVEAEPFTLPAKKTLDILNGFSGDTQVRLSKADNRIRMQAGKGRYTLASLPGDMFPRIASIEPEHRFSLEAGALCDALSRVAFAMASGDVRHFLNGMLFEGCEDHLNLVATDGHRLMRYRVDGSVGGPFRVILPRESVLALAKLCKKADAESPIAVEFTHSFIRFTFDAVRFTTKLVDGTFPDYRRVIPDQYQHRVEIDRETLLGAAKRARVLANEKYPGIRFDFKGTALVLSAHMDEINESLEEIEVKREGPDFTSGFNANILIDALEALDSETITLAFKGENEATALIDDALDNVTDIAMPMRL